MLEKDRFPFPTWTRLTWTECSIRYFSDKCICDKSSLDFRFYISKTYKISNLSKYFHWMYCIWTCRWCEFIFISSQNILLTNEYTFQPFSHDTFFFIYYHCEINRKYICIVYSRSGQCVRNLCCVYITYTFCVMKRAPLTQADPSAERKQSTQIRKIQNHHLPSMKNLCIYCLWSKNVMYRLFEKV